MVFRDGWLSSMWGSQIPSISCALDTDGSLVMMGCSISVA